MTLYAFLLIVAHVFLYFLLGANDVSRGGAEE